MVLAILRRKMIQVDSSKILLGKTFMTNSTSINPLLLTTKIIRSLGPKRNLFHPSFSFLPAATTRRNFITISGSSSKYPYEKDEPLSPWIVPVGVFLIFWCLEDVVSLVTPYSRSKPVIDREDHVRYSYKLEKGVRQEDVMFKIVDNSVLQLSYMYRHHKDPRIVNKELPKGNYANAEIRGWLHNKHDLFLVDIAGFERQPTKKLSDL